MKKLAIKGFLMAIILTSCSEKKSQESVKAPVTSNQELELAIGTGRVEPGDKVVMLSPESAGTVRSIEFKAGDWVKAGATLIELSDETEQAQFNQVNAQVRSQLKAIEVAKAQLKLAENDKAFAKNELDRLNRLKSSSSVTEQSVRDAENVFQRAVAQMEASQQLVLQNQAKLEEFQAQLGYQQALLRKKHLVAPTNGRLLSVDVRRGQFLSQGVAAIEFAPEGALSVWTEIDELLADRLKLGQKAIIRPQGSLDTLSEAEVIFVAPALRKKSLFSDQADNLEDRRVREVQVKLLQPRTNLLMGSRVECVIKLR